jgi:integrase
VALVSAGNVRDGGAPVTGRATSHSAAKVDPRKLFREPEIVRLYRTADGARDLIALRLLFDLAVRRDALRLFRLEDYDPLEHTITFNWKGGGGHTLPVQDELAYLLDHHSRVGYLLYPQKVAGLKHRRRVIWEDRNRPLSRTALYMWWCRTLENAGVDHRRMHDARHTAITRFLRQTGNLKLAQMLAGHSNVATTANTYAHLDIHDLARKMRELPPIPIGG